MIVILTHGYMMISRFVTSNVGPGTVMSQSRLLLMAAKSVAEKAVSECFDAGRSESCFHINDAFRSGETDTYFCLAANPSCCELS